MALRCTNRIKKMKDITEDILSITHLHGGIIHSHADGLNRHAHPTKNESGNELWRGDVFACSRMTSECASY